MGSGAIELGPVERAEELPIGIADEQDGGTYRLVETGDGALFGFSTGPQSWKRYLHPPVLTRWRSGRDERGALSFETEPEQAPPRAFLGVRSCDLHAIAALDDALLRIEHPDEGYRARRESTLIIALNCRRAGGTCFCVSTGTGPRAEHGYDLALTELIGDGAHTFVIDAATAAGEDVLAALPTDEADAEAIEAVEAVVAGTVAGMGRELDTDGLAELLARNLEHPRFDEVSERCLELRQLHERLPDLFLHRGRGRGRPRRRDGGAPATVGLMLQPRLHARERGQRAPFDPLPLPAVDDPQALHLDRAVRQQRRLRRLRTVHQLVPGCDRHHRGGGRDPRHRRSGPMRSIEDLLEEIEVLRGLAPAHRELIAGCGRNQVFADGERLMAAGEAADTFYALRRGTVAIELVPGAGPPIVIETLEAGDVAGWSWLFEPYVTDFDVRARGGVRAIAFDGACLRGKCEDDHDLGYELMHRFAHLITSRLQATRIRLLDVYGSPGGGR